MIRVDFNYNYEDGSSTGMCTVFSSEGLLDFEVTAEMIGASSASYQLPRLTATLSLAYLESDLDEIGYFFRKRAKKGMLVRVTETELGYVNDPSYPQDSNYYFIIDSFAHDEDERTVQVLLTSLSTESGAIIQYGGKKTPISFTTQAIQDLGLDNITRLSLEESEQENIICVKNAEETLLALAWAFDNKRHNIGFAPAKGLGLTKNTVLIPTPSTPVDGVPRYSIEPEHIIDVTKQQPEVVVSDLLTGTLSSGVLVPIVPIVTATAHSSKALKDVLRVLTKDGKLTGWAVATGLSADFYTKDYTVLAGRLRLTLQQFYGEKTFAITPGYLKPSFGDIIRGNYVLMGDSPTYLVSFIDESGYSHSLASGQVTGQQVPFSLNYNDFEKKAASAFNELTIDTNKTIMLTPRVGSQSISSSANPFYVLKTVGVNGVPIFRGCGYDDLDMLIDDMYPIKAHMLDGEAYVLLAGTDYSLTTARLATIDPANPNNASTIYPLSGVALPSGTVNDWAQVTYHDFGDKDDGTTGHYICYSIPSATTGKTIVVYQLLTHSGSSYPASTRYYIEVENFLGIHSTGREKPLIIVTTTGWTSYNTKSVVGNWFSITGSGSSTNWEGVNEAFSSKGDIFVLSRIIDTNGTKTRSIYLMAGDNPFVLSSLGELTVQNTLVGNIPYDPRDISYVIDLPNLNEGNVVPLLDKKLDIDVAAFNYKTTSAGSWAAASPLNLEVPLIGTLCRYKINSEDDYKIGIISKTRLRWDGLSRLTITVVGVSTPSSI